VSARKATMDELTQELSQAGCLPSLVELFVECHQKDPTKRPLMSAIHSRLQKLVMQDARDSQRLREELKRAQAQDRDTYESTWNASYANQPHLRELLDYVATMKSPVKLGFLFSLVLPGPCFCFHSSRLVVRQPLRQCEGKGNMEELEQLATATLCNRPGCTHT